MNLLSRLLRVIRGTVVRAESEKQRLEDRYDALEKQIKACKTIQQTHDMLDAIMDFRDDCRKAGLPKSRFRSLYRLLQFQSAAIINNF